MRSVVCGGLLLLCLSTTARGADDSFALKEAFGLLPQAILQEASAEIAYFADATVIQDLLAAEGKLSPAALTRIGHGTRFRPIAALASRDLATWSAKAGTDFGNLRYFVGLHRQAESAVLWRFTTPEQMRGLVEDLGQKGFSPVEGDGLTAVLANGKPGSIDLAMRDPASPWRGRMGETSVVAAHKSTVIQSKSATWPARLQATEGQPPLAQHPAVAALLDAVQPTLSAGRVVQSILFSPAVGLLAGDPAKFLLGGGAELPKTDEVLENDTARMPGVPLYLAALVADVQFHDRAAMLVVLAYADCAAAAQGGRRMAELWHAGHFDSLAPAEIEIETVEGEMSGCSAVATLADASGQAGENPVFASLLKAIARREPTPLRISGP